MKVQLNRSQAEDLMNFIADFLHNHPGTSKNECLLDIMVRKVWIKLRSRLEGLPKSNYSISLTVEESLGFQVWMDEVRGLIQPTCYIREETLATRISEDLEQVYLKIRLLNQPK